MAQVLQQIEPTDTCARCGLRRTTRELESKGVLVRLCDDCYWGMEQPKGDQAEQA